MLVLSRRVGEKLQIGEDIILTINAITRRGVSIGIEAPDHVPVMRTEIKNQPPKTTKRATLRDYLSQQVKPCEQP